MEDIAATESARKHILDDLAQVVDAELDDDRHWFASNPNRTIRIRRMFPNERRQLELIDGDVCPPGMRAFVAVKQLQPGARIRRAFFAPRGFQLPVTEMGAARVLRTATENTLLGDLPFDEAIALFQADLKASNYPQGDGGRDQHCSLFYRTTTPNR